MNLIFKKSLVFLLIMAFILPFGFFSFPKKAEAVVPVHEEFIANSQEVGPIAQKEVGISLGGLVQTVKDLLSGNISSSQILSKVPLGGLSWDAAAFYFARQALGILTAQTVNWIRTGGLYPGGGSGPLFVTDISGYFAQVADNAAGLFLEQVLDPEIFNLLCTPWRNQFVNLLQQTSGPYLPSYQRARCTLTDIVANISGVAPGDFYTRTQYWNQIRLPQNNIYDTFLSAYYGRSTFLESREAAARQELSFGKGFLSWKKKELVDTGQRQSRCLEWIYNDKGEVIGCAKEDFGPGGKGYPIYKEVEKVETPGSVIEDRLAEVLGSDVRSLEVADELNEVIAAILERLVSEIFTGGKGLAGWSPAGSPAWEPFQKGQSFELNKNIYIDSANALIAIEEKYKSLKEQEKGVSNSKISVYKDLEQCEKELCELKTPLSPKCGEITRQPEINQINNRIQTIDQQIENSNKVIAGINDIKTRISQAKSTEELINLSLELDNQKPLLHDPQQAQNELSASQNELNQVQGKLSQCQADK